jgi:anthranilate phosphoribosyltransferase
MTLAPFVQIVAKGKGRARALTQQEASDAMSIILSGQAEPEAVGALLMVLRLRGEEDAEIAGFTQALRAQVAAKLPQADLDWPCYAAGRTRGAPLFLLAAKLVAQAGYRVALHGWNSHQNADANPRRALTDLNLECSFLRYYPLETLSPEAFDLLKLRDTFGLRSCFNTVLRMWNPAQANASVQGVFHPSYRGLQSRAAELLGDQNLTVIKGGGGEFERNPAKEAAVFGLRNGIALNELAPAIVQDTRRLHDLEKPIDLAGLWAGTVHDPFAQSTVTGTAALALWTVGAAQTMAEAQSHAVSLWQNRMSQDRKTA